MPFFVSVTQFIHSSMKKMSKTSQSSRQYRQSRNGRPVCGSISRARRSSFVSILGMNNAGSVTIPVNGCRPSCVTHRPAEVGVRPSVSSWPEGCRLLQWGQMPVQALVRWRFMKRPAQSPVSRIVRVVWRMPPAAGC